MKKLLFLLCLLSWSALNAQKTINRPPFIAKATETIEIAAVHLSDTATVIDVDAKFTPKYWIRIAPATCLVADNGERYQVRQGVGTGILDARIRRGHFLFDISTFATICKIIRFCGRGR